MPYKRLSELPDSVKENLPHHAQEIYKEAFNSAHEQYSNQSQTEETAHKVAWAAVKKKYKKKADGKWIEK